MTSSSWNQFINQFLLEFGRIDWKVYLSMLKSIEKSEKKTPNKKIKILIETQNQLRYLFAER